MPLCVLLGGSVGPVPAYNSNGLWLHATRRRSPPRRLELREEGGFTGLEAAARPRPRSPTIWRRSRRCATPSATTSQLMVDFNQGLNLGEALQRCHALDDQGLAWIEEPIVYDNLDGYAQLGGRAEDADPDRRELLRPARAAQGARRSAPATFVMPDFMRIGGVTGWLRAAAIAGAAGVPMSTHLYPEVAAHVMRVTETAHWLEWQDWADPILQQPYAVRDGLLHIPDVPGTGLAWNEDAVRAYLVD